jgi:hypothetical protein
MLSTMFAAVLLLFFEIPDLLPLDETLELKPDVEMSDSLAVLLEGSDLAFTLESVTRRLSILGWASERYDLDVGEVLKGDIHEETVSFYVYPEGSYSFQFADLIEGMEVVIFASSDSSNDTMEGFRTVDGDWNVICVFTNI